MHFSDVFATAYSGGNLFNTFSRKIQQLLFLRKKTILDNDWDKNVFRKTLFTRNKIHFKRLPNDISGSLTAFDVSTSSFNANVAVKDFWQTSRCLWRQHCLHPFYQAPISNILRTIDNIYVTVSLTFKTWQRDISLKIS